MCGVGGDAGRETVCRGGAAGRECVSVCVCVCVCVCTTPCRLSVLVSIACQTCSCLQLQKSQPQKVSQSRSLPLTLYITATATGLPADPPTGHPAPQAPSQHSAHLQWWSPACCPAHDLPTSRCSGHICVTAQEVATWLHSPSG